jgi:poly-gamma-glutamate synthesis protein (capsule biosynthesis protein)
VREISEGDKLTLAATGDSMINRRFSFFDDDRFMSLIKILRDADVTFTNFETLIHDFEYPHAGTGVGHMFQVSPWVVDELKWAGIDMVSTANNHSSNYSYEVLLNTKDILTRGSIANSGSGWNLGEARLPAFFDMKKGRVALISAATTFSPESRATDCRPEIMGKPGINGIRLSTRYFLDPDSAKKQREIFQKLGLWGGPHNLIVPWGKDKREFGVRENFVGPLGSVIFVEGEKNKVEMSLNKLDVEANIRMIRDARRQADLVLMSVHTHEGEGFFPSEKPSEFNISFAHACIDAGADVFLGHGSHVPRGIELYKEKPILYSMGNFIATSNTVPRHPAAAYEPFGLGPEATPADFIDASWDPHIGLVQETKNPWWWQSAVFAISLKGGKLTDIKLYPITLQMDAPRTQLGRPLIAIGKQAKEIIQRVKKLSEPFGTQIEYRNGIGITTL